MDGSSGPSIYIYMADIAKAEKKINGIISRFLMNDSMLLEAHNLFKKVPSTSQLTMGIDSRSIPPVIKYNPNFVNIISTEQLESIMTQDALKILLKHPTTRLCKPRNISGLASSITVIPFSLGNILKNQNMEEFYPSAERFDLEEGKCFEEYFRKLIDKFDETQEKIKRYWNSLSDEEKENLINTANNKQDKEQNNESKDQQCGGNCDKDKNKDGDGYHIFNNESQAIKEYYDPNSTSSMDWGGNDVLDADIKTLVKKNENNPKCWGNVSGEMYEEILSAHTPKISWKEVVRRFNKSVMSMRTFASRMKINRRHDLRLPGYKRDFDTNIIFAVDASGSMTNEDLAEGFAVINNVCKHAQITYVSFDTKILVVEHDLKRAKDRFEIGGRGGTDFQDVINFANTNKSDGLVIYTDGCASAPTQPIRTKVLWLMSTKEYKPPVNWGFVAHLERYE